MREFNSDDHYTYHHEQESLRGNGVALIITKRVQNAVLGCNLKNNRMISVRFQGKPFIIMVIQVYAPTSNAEVSEVEQFYEDLQNLLEVWLKSENCMEIPVVPAYLEFHTPRPNLPVTPGVS